MMEIYDAGDEKKVRKRRTKIQIAKDKEVEELRQILEDPKVRWWMWRLLSYCGVFRSTSHPEGHQMAIHSGLRDAGLWVLTEMFEANRSAFVKMQNEADEREKK